MLEKTFLQEDDFFLQMSEKPSPCAKTQTEFRETSFLEYIWVPFLVFSVKYDQGYCHLTRDVEVRYEGKTGVGVW